MTVNLIKLSVGSSSPSDLAAWQQTPAAQTTDGFPKHVTRMWPKRADEIIGKGSIYWVIDGAVQCRQNVIRFDEVIGADGIRRCAIVLEPELVLTAHAPKRPFQGWRYLEPQDAPPDLRQSRATDDPLPEELTVALAEIGVI